MMQLDLHRARNGRRARRDMRILLVAIAVLLVVERVRVVLLRADARPRTLARIPHGAYPRLIGGSEVHVAGSYVAWTKALRDGSARQQVTVYDWRARRAIRRWRAPRFAGRTGRLRIDLDVDGRLAVNTCDGRGTRCLSGWLSPRRDGLQHTSTPTSRGIAPGA